MKAFFVTVIYGVLKKAASDVWDSLVGLYRAAANRFKDRREQYKAELVAREESEAQAAQTEQDIEQAEPTTQEPGKVTLQDAATYEPDYGNES